MGVSTDYLLRDDCLEGRDTPAAQKAEESLQRRTRAVNLGIILRVAVLIAALVLNLWQVTGDAAWNILTETTPLGTGEMGALYRRTSLRTHNVTNNPRTAMSALSGIPAEA